ncbi:F-ATPase gamma subunit [Chromobacterium violaceum]|uniref:F-ATPase gamma subunit n=1 Tax=Chromobacterium violaceum TaxID=536 RepID=A0A3S4ICK2_CHRVL|nr:F-ATPase gamma subunit [Chromobacterium violaceum]
MPKMEKLIGPLTVLFRQYAEGELDAVYIVYSSFVNTMKQEPALEQLLPLTRTTWWSSIRTRGITCTSRMRRR